MVMEGLLGLSLILPLLLAGALGSIRLRAVATALVPTASLPPLVLAFFPGLEIYAPWLLLGIRLGVDDTGAPFLLLTGLLWTAAGVYARGYLAGDPARVRFDFFYLLTYTGTLGVFLSLDATGFYLFFTLMSFAAYGLIIHDGSAEALRAGRVYLVLALLGEALLLIAVIMIGAGLGNAELRQLGPLFEELSHRDWITGLILAGFGIKMGAVPLHVWLPLAHPCAPTPASAVLSGIIIKAGLIGWLRFLPLGVLQLDDWGLLCLGIGTLSVFYGVLVGLPQTRPKTVLAYSSISQMGLLLILLGIGLTNPGAWPFFASIVSLFALHHGLAKAALFLGVGVVQKSGRWAGWCLALPALALVGAPLTSGALAKPLLKDAAYLAPDGWSELLLDLMPLSSLATGLLMARFLFLTWPRSQPQGPLPTGMITSWLALLVLGLGLPWWWAWQHMPKAIDETLGWDALLSGLMPLAGAVVLALAVGGIWRLTRFRVSLPEGDMLELLSLRIGFRPAATRNAAGEWAFEAGNLRRVYAVLARSERRLRLWNVAGTLFLGLILGMIVLLAR